MRTITFCAIVATMWMSGCGASVQQLTNDGISAFQVGQTDKAAALLQQVLDRDTSDSEVLYYMGRVRHSQKLYEQAMFYYRCAVDVDPDNRQARQWLARALADAGYAPALSAE